MFIKNSMKASISFNRSTYKCFYRKVSALYITGDKAKEHFSALTPFFDFKHRLKNVENLQTNINRRQLNINIPEIYQLWEMYQHVLEKKKLLEQRRIEIAEEMRKITKDGNENLKNKYQIEGIRIRDDLKILKQNLYPLEKKFIDEYLNLPNDLHEDTLDTLENVKFIYGQKSNDHLAMNHLAHTNLIEYNNPYNYYLLEDAAKFDLLLPFQILDQFKQKEFVHFSNPDFLKTIAVEGAGLQSNNVFQICDNSAENILNMLHVIGQGSMLSYLGYICKLAILKKQFPLKLITSGKEYSIINDEHTKSFSGLYSVSQSTKVQLFLASMDTDAKDLFHETLQQIQEIYCKFDQHFRIVYASPSQLKASECLRANMEMYSPFLKCYISVGNLCYHSDFISKRLLFNYKDEKIFKFPHLISGTVIDLAPVLAVLLENKTKLHLLLKNS